MTTRVVPPPTGSEVRAQITAGPTTTNTSIFLLVDGLGGASQALMERPSPIQGAFQVLADWWHEATDSMSSPSKKVNHSAYQRIIDLGHSATPLILRDLRDRGGYWFYALERIEGWSPLPKDRPTGFGDVRDAWVNWGINQGYL